MTESPNNWEISYTLHELGNILRQNNVIGAENVRHIEVTSWTPHGRIAKLKVTDENENIYDISANDLRAWAGYTRIKSTKFEIKLSKDSVQFSGSGFGHGVGMCQTGARLMALAGSDFRTILKRYYPDAQLNTSATVAASH